MPKDKSILLVANARPFEIGKLYFFRDRRLGRFAQQARVGTIDPPSLRRWTEPSAWLDAHSKSGLATKATRDDSGAIPASLANEGSLVGVPPGISDDESARKERAAIDAETSHAIVGVSAEAQRAARSEA